jgi:hypothetical protein
MEIGRVHPPFDGMDHEVVGGGSAETPLHAPPTLPVEKSAFKVGVRTTRGDETLPIDIHRLRHAPRKPNS